MATPQIMALDQALAEVQVPPPDPVRWAGQIADVARQMRTVIARHRGIIPCSVGFLPGGGRALGCGGPCRPTWSTSSPNSTSAPAPSSPPRSPATALRNRPNSPARAGGRIHHMADI